MSQLPELIVLGTAQDGGLPHAGCLCSACEAARIDRTCERLPASLGVSAAQGSLLIDATSAFERQIHRLWLAGSRESAGGRFESPSTIVLTHAHTGHYVGLWQLDRSVMAARMVRIVGTGAMTDFLAAQEPWATMQREGFIVLEAAGTGSEFEPLPGVRLTFLDVPHRSEWKVDTVAVRINGPRHSVLYLPDIDSWDAWDQDICEVADSVDVALIDGCFWEPFHVPGVPHPPIRESLQRLAPLVAAGTTRIVFTHLNHSNPVCDPTGAEAGEVARLGFAVVREGERFTL